DLILSNKYIYSSIIKALEEIYSLEQIKLFFKKFIDKEFTNKRINVSNNKFFKEMFGKNSSYFKESVSFKQNYNESITNIVSEKLEEQKEIFIKNNQQSMNLSEDKWVMYFIKGTSLNKREFDFSKIESETLRKEVKMYFKH